MLNYNLLNDEGILILTPTGALEESDFAAVARAIDPFIEEKGDLRGLVIEAESFPGWNDFGAFISHLRFIRDHHRYIGKVATVSDSTILSVGPRVASHFVNAEVKHFESADREAALDWIREPSGEGED
jgi:hypothetical protein